LLNEWKGFQKPSGSNGSDASNDSSGVRISQKALKLVNDTMSLSFLDLMLARVVKETHENYMSLSQAPLSYLLQLTEFLDIQDFLEEDINRQVEQLSKRH